MNSIRLGMLPEKGKSLQWLVGFCLLASCLPSGATTRRREDATAHPLPIATPARVDSPAKDLLLPLEAQRHSDALAAYIQGFIAEDNADNDAMLEQYQKVLAIEPGYSELAVKVALELARRGEIPAGIDVLKDCIKASPRDSATYIYLSQIYCKYLKKPEVGLKYALQALELDPSNLASYGAAYDIYTYTSQPKKAEQILDRASRLSVRDPQFWLQLGRLYTELLLKLDGSTPPESLKKMSAAYEKARALSPEDLDVTQQAADFYISARQWKSAIPLYQALIETKKVSSDPSVLANRLKVAQCFSAIDKYDESINILRESIKENPLQQEAYDMLGQVYEEKGDVAGALASFQQYLLLNPALWQNYARVAEIEIELKEYDKAIDTLVEARRKFPERPELTYRLATALSEVKRSQEALTKFEEAEHEAQNYRDELLDQRFYLSYGAAAEQAGMIDKAAELLKKAIQMDPQHSGQACNYLGFMWADRGEHLEEAGELIQRALVTDPNNAAFIDSLGWLYFKRGQPEKALPQLLKAAQTIQPADAVVYDHIGDTYLKLGNSAQAVNYWQKAVVLDRDNKAISEKIEDARQKMTQGKK